MHRKYAEYLKRFNGKLEHKNKSEYNLAAVICEGREDFFFPYVVKNFMTLVPECNLYIFHGNNNVDYINDITKKCDIIKYHTDVPNFNPKSFNLLLKEKQFWNVFKEERVLVFQTDCICCKPLDENFLTWDMIGAPCGLNGKTMNGGLSIRNPKTMIEACNYTEYLDDEPEDVFFSKALRLMGKEMPDGYTASEFSVESFYYHLPFGVHGTDKYYHGNNIVNTIVNESIKLTRGIICS